MAKTTAENDVQAEKRASYFDFRVCWESIGVLRTVLFVLYAYK